MAISKMSKPSVLQPLFVLMLLGAASAQLSSTFYDSSCPNVLSTIQSGVKTAVSNEARMGASLLRLHFHDCFVNGCDGSILLADNATFQGEQGAFPNKGSVRGYDIIDTIKTQVESLCPGVVSCADIVAVVARDSVVALGGPSWTVQLGRRDATTASLSAANSPNNLPAPSLSFSGLHSIFQAKGFTDDEMVALSGGHTIGQARCISYTGRIYNDANIDSKFVAALQSNCPQTSGSSADNNLPPLDKVSPTSFDNSYYTDLMNMQGLLHSDQELFNNQTTDSQVSTYAASSSTFFSDFASAMVKMGSLSPLTGSAGEIRTVCSTIN
ncbi:hypothetical protein V2J09_012901 [Rumex salicifolius]